MNLDHESARLQAVIARKRAWPSQRAIGEGASAFCHRAARERRELAELEREFQARMEKLQEKASAA